jgi:spore coat-associated protein N
VPGYTQDVTITLNDVGNTPGTPNSTMTATGADGRCTEPEQIAEGGSCAAGGNLQDQMTVQILSTPTSSTAGAARSVSNFLSAGGLGAGGTLVGGASGSYKLRFALPNLAGTQNNNVQGDSIRIDSTFNLAQA